MTDNPARLAIILGPYRNLTTLTAAVLSLHPACQVLNHGAERLWASGDELDFISRPEEPVLSRFLAVAAEESRAGKRGDFGGSILHSHAYDDSRMKALYRSRFGDRTLKAEASCLVWKESMRIQRRLAAEEGVFERICDAFHDIRFIMPIRDPLDCAVSNLSTGHIKHLGLATDAPLERAVDAVLSAFSWGLEMRDRRPDRVFVFTQHDERPALFVSLAAFLGLPRSEVWLDDAMTAFDIRRKGGHGDTAIAYAREAARRKLRQWPDILDALAGASPGM